MTNTNVELNVVDYNRVCRTCMKEGEMKSLFEDCASEVCIVEMIMSCTFVQIHESDGLPDQICLQCLQEVNNAYKFAQKCELTDEILRSFLPPSKRALKAKNKPSNETKPRENYIEIIDSRKTIEEMFVISDEETKEINNKTPVIKNQKQIPEEKNNKPDDSDSDYFLDSDPTFSDEPSSNVKTKSNQKKIEEMLVISDEETEEINTKNSVIETQQQIPEKTKNKPDDLDADYFLDGDPKTKTSLKRKAETNLNQKNVENDALETINETEIDNTDEVISEEINSSVKKVAIEPKSISQKMSPPYECKMCGDQFPVYYMLKEHCKNAKHSKSDDLKRNCPICLKYVSSSYMTRHVRTHTQEKPYCCEVCGKRFIFSGNLKRHMRIHSGEKPYKCELCDRAFTQQQTLKEHLRVHTREKPHVCYVCGKAFTHLHYFKMHLKKHEQEDTDSLRNEPKTRKPWTRKTISGKEQNQEVACDICDQVFRSMAGLKRHLLSHGEKSYVCEECGWGFTNIERLKNHLKSHSPDKQYRCEICEKRFVLKSSLKDHILIHTGEKPYQCDYCDKAFIQQGQLTYHLRVHTGEKPYSCTYCGKSFALNGNLTVHMRTHTGETPYHCGVCDKGFRDSSSMKKHQRGHGVQVSE